MGEDRRLALHGSTNKEKRVLTDSFLNRRRGICTVLYEVSVKPLPAKFGIAVSPSARYTFWWQQHSLRRSMLDSLPSQSLDTAAQRLNQMAIAESQSVVRELMRPLLDRKRCI
jgi:hypothetical protein